MPCASYEAFDPVVDAWPSLADDALHLWLLPHRHGQRSTDALRTGIAGYLGIDPDSVELQRSMTGRPLLIGPTSDLRFSASHSGETLLLGFLRSATSDDRIGVDVEHIKSRPNALELARRYFTRHEAETLSSLPQAEREQAFYRLWTAKEALLKALGQGLAHGLAQVGLGFSNGSLELLELDIASARVEDDVAIATPSIQAWNLLECLPLPGYRSCVAYSGVARGIRAWRIR